jgi:leucyl/phenylalanyl-tRNA--protein transferase
MADSRDDPRVFLVDPEQRGVLPLDERFHVSKRLARTVRSEAFQVRIDTAFPAVLEACAAERSYAEDTWINSPIQALYGELFARGLAHSVECWREGVLVGGLYGVSLGAAFFGESMFSTARDASKTALVHLIARLRFGGYRLLDSQFMTDHLAQFGAEEIGRAEYHRRLDVALESDGDFYLFPPSAHGGSVLETIRRPA